jgi:hypothetical protein
MHTQWSAGILDPCSVQSTQFTQVEGPAQGKAALSIAFAEFNSGMGSPGMPTPY